MSRHFAGLFLLALAGTVVIAGTPVRVEAAILSFGLDLEFSGATAPESMATPWLVATFDDKADNDGKNGVRLTLTAPNLTDAEFVAGWYLNLDPSLDPTKLAFNDLVLSGISNFTVANIKTGVNAFKADGDGWFDIKFEFPPPPGNANKFTVGDTLVVDLVYPTPITVDSFDFSSLPGGANGTYLSAAHVLAIGLTNSDSGWIGDRYESKGVVPEPASLAAWSLLGLAAVARRLRRSRKPA